VVPIKRRSRRHYGLKCSLPFREGIDPKSSAYVCEWTNEKYCGGRIEWAVAKAKVTFLCASLKANMAQGDVIDETTHIVTKYYTTYIEGESLLESGILYSSSADVAPTYASDPDVEKAATLKHTIDRDNLKKCPSKTVDGQLRWKVDYENEIYVGTKEGTLSFNVVRDGKTWGKTEIIFDGKKASSRRKPV
jgi:hypothetical protein